VVSELCAFSTLICLAAICKLDCFGGSNSGFYISRIIIAILIILLASSFSASTLLALKFITIDMRKKKTATRIVQMQGIEKDLGYVCLNFFF
jgi:hypothetical protein